MRRELHSLRGVLVVALIACVLVLVAYAQKPVDQPKLVLRISTFKKVYVEGEKIPVTMELENVSSDVVHVPAELAVRDFCAKELGFRVGVYPDPRPGRGYPGCSSESYETPNQVVSALVPDRLKRKEPTIVLPPGASISMRTSVEPGCTKCFVILEAWFNGWPDRPSGVEGAFALGKLSAKQIKVSVLPSASNRKNK